MLRSWVGFNLQSDVRVLTEGYNGKTQYESTYAYTLPNGKTNIFTFKEEELDTTGISYYAGYKYGQGIARNAWYWGLSENALRDEHGLNRRVRYEVDR